MTNTQALQTMHACYQFGLPVSYKQSQQRVSVNDMQVSFLIFFTFISLKTVKSCGVFFPLYLYCYPFFLFNSLTFSLISLWHNSHFNSLWNSSLSAVSTYMSCLLEIYHIPGVANIYTEGQNTVIIKYYKQKTVTYHQLLPRKKKKERKQQLFVQPWFFLLSKLGFMLKKRWVKYTLCTVEFWGGRVILKG